MNKFIEIAVIGLVLVLFLFIVKSAFGFDFVEDRYHTPYEPTIDMILTYCLLHPHGNITYDLVDTGMISKFYNKYTCGNATQYKLSLHQIIPVSNQSKELEKTMLSKLSSGLNFTILK